MERFNFRNLIMVEARIHAALMGTLLPIKLGDLSSGRAVQGASERGRDLARLERFRE